MSTEHEACKRCAKERTGQSLFRMRELVSPRICVRKYSIMCGWALWSDRLFWDADHWSVSDHILSTGLSVSTSIATVGSQLLTQNTVKSSIQWSCAVHICDVQFARSSSPRPARKVVNSGVFLPPARSQRGRKKKCVAWLHYFAATMTMTMTTSKTEQRTGAPAGSVSADRYDRRRNNFAPNSA